ncbi:MAG: hypothetical protein GY696_19945 [Gammaproteobacteria bacterium]|nr:hypothetical protein [Gammaproteobacteria bacterium]
MKANPVMNRIDSESYGNFNDAVIRQFSKDKSVVWVQFEFQNRQQESSESINELTSRRVNIMALRSLAADCSFNEKHNEMIALQLVAGCLSKTRRMNCLRMRTLDMDDTINALQIKGGGYSVNGGPPRRKINGG